MAAQQNVKHENASKKTKRSKLKASVDKIKEGSTCTGKKSNINSQSSVQNYENNALNNNNSLTSRTNKKKSPPKNENGDDKIFLQNGIEGDNETGENSLRNTLIKKQITTTLTENACMSPEVKPSNGSEGLSKAKKRRLRKQKLKIASASSIFSECQVDSEKTVDAVCSKNHCNKDDTISIINDTSLKNVKDEVQCNVPSRYPNKSLLKNKLCSPNTFSESPSDSLLPSDHCDENKPKVEEQKISAHMFNDILLNLMQTLNTNDEVVSKDCLSDQPQLEVGREINLKVETPCLENDTTLIDKIKEFSESFSKLECVEILLNNSAVGVSDDNVDKSSNISEAVTKDLALPLPVDDSSGMLQVNDKKNIVAENLGCSEKDSCDTVSPVNAIMDDVKDTEKTSLKNNKSRDEIKAEREAKKVAKLAAKKAKASGVKNVAEKVSDVVDGCVIPKKPILPAVLNNYEKKLNAVVISSPQQNQEQNKLAISDNIPGKSKAELRAERREKQEAQRAAKAAQTTQKEIIKQPPKKDKEVPKKKIVEVVHKELDDKLMKEVIIKTKNKVKLFSHLYFEKKPFEDYDCCNVHPAILQLGAQYEARVISGSNARCLALLHTLKKVIRDYSTPSKQEFSRALESTLVRSMKFLNCCRPLSVSMTNAVRHIKWHLTQLPNTVSDSEARHKLYDVIDTYIREQIDVAGEAICNTVKKKISNGDVIVTYGCSSLVYRILLESHRSGTKFSVVVVDDGHWFEGKEMLKRLVREGLECTYTHLLTATFTIREASKVLLGAHALLTNGYVMSRAGTSIVALIAHSYNVPVLVCCETHKFCERAQTDAFVYNELGDPDEFLAKKTGAAAQLRSNSCLKPLSIAFDVTPSDHVTAVVTELGILPCTSVPVILRMKPSEIV